MIKQQLEEKIKAPTLKQIKPYYDANHTIDYTADKTRFARGTVRKCFHHLDDILIEEIDTDFIRMQKIAKSRGLTTLDKLIGDFKEILTELKILNKGHMEREKALWKKNKTHQIELNKWLTDKIAKYTKDIFNMEQIKVMIQMKPTADITLQHQIDELLAKVKPEDMQKLMDAKEKKE